MIAVRRSIPAGLLAVGVALAGVVALEIAVWQQPGAAITAGGPNAVAAVRQPEAVDVPGQQNDWLNEILARPLFNPDRRPAAAGVRGR